MSNLHPDQLAERLCHSADRMSDAALQRLMAALVRAYAARIEGDARRLPILPEDAGVTATEAVVTVAALLEAVDVAVFELGMWQALGKY